MKIDAVFVKSAAGASDFLRDGPAELALIGRSNVGKSSLINALVRQRLARTSAAPGKTRLANIYRIRRGTAAAFDLVDLPGYGYARGDRRELEAVTRAYFGDRSAEASRSDVDGARRPNGARGLSRAPRAALLLIDARHPGLEADVDAWRWLRSTLDRAAIVATKIDKLSRAQRPRAVAENEAVFEHPVLPVSAATGEGLEALWKLIDNLTKPGPK